MSTSPVTAPQSQGTKRFVRLQLTEEEVAFALKVHIARESACGRTGDDRHAMLPEHAARIYLYSIENPDAPAESVAAELVKQDQVVANDRRARAAALSGMAPSKLSAMQIHSILDEAAKNPAAKPEELAKEAEAMKSIEKFLDAKPALGKGPSSIPQRVAAMESDISAMKAWQRDHRDSLLRERKWMATDRYVPVECRDAKAAFGSMLTLPTPGPQVAPQQSPSR